MSAMWVGRVAMWVALSLAGTAGAEPVVIKLGTLAPSGSTWHQRLRELGERWSELSGGAVKLRVYAGGVQGSEGDMLRKIAIGQLDAAAVSNVGLHDVTAEPQVLTVPLILEEPEEFDQVFGKIRPRLDAALARRDLVAVQWAQVGQVRLFCARRCAAPADVAGARVFAWEGDPASADMWRATGMRPVVLSSVDLVPALQTGMIDCLANVPVYVLTARLFEKARFMSEARWGQVVAATVVARRSWERIPPALRPALLAAARELGLRVDADSRRADAEALAAMERQGLTVLAADPGSWRKVAEATWPALRGQVVPADLFDEVRDLRDAFRRGRVADRAAAAR